MSAQRPPYRLDTVCQKVRNRLLFSAIRKALERIKISFAEEIKQCVGFEGRIVYDGSRPDGTLRKLLDNSRIQGLGRKPTTALKEGLRL